MADANFYPAKVATGATEHAMDAIDAASLVDKDVCMIVSAFGYDFYEYSSTSTSTPDGVNVVVPANSTGPGRWLLVPSKAASTYTGKAERTVGGISANDTFNVATMEQMWDALLHEEKFPTLSNPSSTFNSDYTGYREVGEIITIITFSATFDRGSISPQYTAASPYRAGLPNQYTYVGTGLANQPSTSLTDSQQVTNYTVVANGQSWTCQVAYDVGVQPKSSYDNDYSTPLSAGSTSVDTQTITGVLPVYATTSVITTLTKQGLQSNGSTFTATLVAESGANKQTVDFPADIVLSWGAITGIEFYNNLSSSWEWINGSAANSLLTFTETTVTHTVQSISRDYTRFTHNGPTTGTRQTRWHT